jgi:putative flippase GtrA
VIEWLRFGVVGTFGFLVDAAVLWTLTDRLAVYPAVARVASFGAAGTATWLLNRVITFPSRAGRRRLAEWQRYLAVNGVGAGVNYLVFVTAVAAVPAITPIGALVVASLVALPINFFGSRHYAFRG